MKISMEYNGWDPSADMNLTATSARSSNCPCPIRRKDQFILPKWEKLSNTKSRNLSHNRQKRIKREPVSF
jgi:hypothetical protein